MTSDGTSLHDRTVDAWLARLGDGSATRIATAFERAFGAMWNRAQRPLGDVTLAAIVERVIHGAAASAPLLSTLRVDMNGLHCEELIAQARNAPLAEIRTAVRSFVIEFLSVLGELTADVLTSAMHDELAKAREADDLMPEAHDSERPSRGEGRDA
jgi:hypothetical protein